MVKSIGSINATKCGESWSTLTSDRNIGLLYVELRGASALATRYGVKLGFRITPGR